MSRDSALRVDPLVEAAADASAWLAAADPGQRSHLLEAVAGALDESADDLVAVADRETGLGPVRLRGEVARTTGQLRLFSSAVQEGSWLEVIIDHADRQAAPPRSDLRRLMVPLGPVAVYAASNFPFAFSVAGGDSASALAAGCPVVVKAHPGHPRLSAVVGDLVREALRSAGAPDGVFGVVDGLEEGRDLIRHPDIRAAAFTGSLRAGRQLMDLAASRPDPIPFYGELGSINPVLVGPIHDADQARTIATGLLASFTLGQGQFCTKPGLVLIPGGSPLPDLLSDLLTTPGGRLLTPSIAAAYDDGVSRLDRLEGVRRVATGSRGAAAPGSAPSLVPGQPPAVFVTDVATALAAGHTVLDEVFGPVTVLVEYDSRSELLALLARLPGALTGTVHAHPSDLADLGPAIEVLRTRVGRLLFDEWPTGVAVVWSMQHGGPWPSTTSSLFTSVGVTAMRRFLRPLTYQNTPPSVLPAALQDSNPWRVPRRMDGVLSLPGTD